jgi:hypothetical protein
VVESFLWTLSAELVVIGQAHLQPKELNAYSISIFLGCYIATIDIDTSRRFKCRESIYYYVTWQAFGPVKRHGQLWLGLSNWQLILSSPNHIEIANYNIVCLLILWYKWFIIWNTFKWKTRRDMMEYSDHCMCILLKMRASGSMRTMLLLTINI